MNFNLSVWQSGRQMASQSVCQTVCQSVSQSLHMFIASVLEDSNQTVTGRLVVMASDDNFYYR